MIYGTMLEIIYNHRMCGILAGQIILKEYAIGRTKGILRSIVPICLTRECGKDINMDDIVCFYCFTHNITIHIFEHA